MLPFIYPIWGNCLISLNIIESVEQIQRYNDIFKYFNIALMIMVFILLIYNSKISVSDIIDKIASNFDFSYKKGDSEIQIKHAEAIVKENFSKKAKEVKEEAREELINGETKSQNINCKECKIEEVIAERESLRYFSAYQVTNKFSREILTHIKNNDKIQVEMFYDDIKEYYEKTIKNMGKSRKQDFIERKINELLYNLRYLNIIEYTEDDTYIILTKNGEEFVKGYEEVG